MANDPHAQKTEPEHTPHGVGEHIQAACAWAGMMVREKPYLSSFAVVSVICVFLMIFVDAWAAQDIKIQGGPAFTQFFADVGVLGRAEWFIGAAALAIIFSQFALYFNLVDEARLRVRRYTDAALFVIASILAAGIVVNVAKFIIGRFRPRELFENGAYGFSMFNTDFGMNSFPSGHSQMVFSLAVALFIIYPRYDVLYFAFAIAIAASRALATVHFPSDVLMGSYIGIVVPLLLKKYFFDARGIQVQLSFPRDAKLTPSPDEDAASKQAKLPAPGQNAQASEEPLKPFRTNSD